MTGCSSYDDNQLFAPPTPRRRHAEFFLTLVEEAEPHLASPRRPPWLELNTEPEEETTALYERLRQAEAV